MLVSRTQGFAAINNASTQWFRITTSNAIEAGSRSVVVELRLRVAGTVRKTAWVPSETFE